MLTVRKLFLSLYNMSQMVPGQFTVLLKDWSAGDPAALDALTPIVYQELRRLASARLRNERPGHTLQSTALIHEAYLKLVDHDQNPSQTCFRRRGGGGLSHRG